MAPPIWSWSVGRLHNLCQQRVCGIDQRWLPELWSPIYGPNNPPAQYPSAEQFSSGDVNKDGHPDLLVASVSAWNSGQLYGGRTQIFIGNGDGTFSAGQVLDASGEAGLNPRLVQNAVLTDTDGDGCLDAIVVDSYSDGIVYPGDRAYSE